MSSVVCQMSVRRMRPASAPQSICMVSTTAPIKKAGEQFGFCDPARRKRIYSLTLEPTRNTKYYIKYYLMISCQKCCMHLDCRRELQASTTTIFTHQLSSKLQAPIYYYYFNFVQLSTFQSVLYHQAFDYWINNHEQSFILSRFYTVKMNVIIYLADIVTIMNESPRRKFFPVPLFLHIQPHSFYQNVCCSFDFFSYITCNVYMAIVVIT